MNRSQIAFAVVLALLSLALALLAIRYLHDTAPYAHGVIDYHSNR